MNPSPLRSILDLLRHGQPQESATVQGWLRTKREQKEFTFLEINDGSSLKGLQVILSHQTQGYETIVKSLTTGCALQATGILAQSPGKGQSIEMQATIVELVGACDGESYPLQKKRHSLEFLRTIAHLRPRTNTMGAVLRVRNTCASGQSINY